MYDLYKLTPLMKFDNSLVNLVKEVREHRANMEICPSAKNGVDVVALVEEFCDNDFYKEDYQAITAYFIADYVSYEDVIHNMRSIVGKLFLYDE